MAELMDKALDAGITVLATPCIYMLCVQMKAFIDHNDFPAGRHERNAEMLGLFREEIIST